MALLIGNWGSQDGSTLVANAVVRRWLSVAKSTPTGVSDTRRSRRITIILAATNYDLSRNLLSCAVPVWLFLKHRRQIRKFGPREIDFGCDRHGRIYPKSFFFPIIY